MTPAFLTNIPPMGYLIIALVVLVLFGRGKISAMMGEMGKGITAFKKGVSDAPRLREHLCLKPYPIRCVLHRGAGLRARGV